jgi:hypothetical protein
LVQNNQSKEKYFMFEKEFTKANALKKSVGNLARNAGAVVRGQMVIVPIDAGVYAARVDKLLSGASDPDITATDLVEKALDRAPLSIGDCAASDEHYGLEEGFTGENMWSASQHPFQMATERILFIDPPRS